MLDLPCGAGRFWPLLAEKDNRVIIGADNSADMLAVACAGQPDGVVKRVRPLQTSAFAIDLPDSSVDNIFCMRLLHHIGEADDRRVLLREFHRVTRDSVILSLWVDGNFKAWKRRRMEARRVANGEQTGYQNRFVLPAETVEREFRDAGFVVQKHLDFIPLYHMWRVYILRKGITMAPDLASLQRISGDSAIDQWLQVPGSWVEEPNERRGGASGVQRVYTGDGRLLYRKQQTGHVYRDWQRPFGYPTAMRERDALRAFESLGIRVPRLVYSGCRKVDGQWQALLVTEALEGFSSLDECYARGDQDRWGEAKHQRILQQIGATIARMNLAHWQHGCLYPKHIFVRVEGEAIEVALIDLEKSRRRLTVNKASQHDLKQLKRRSSWTGAQWQAFIYGYQTAFGSAIKGLQT